MGTIRRTLGSIYVKFLGIFFVVLILTTSIAPLLFFMTQLRRFYGVVENHLYENAVLVRTLITETGISEDEVAEYVDLLAIDMEFSAQMPKLDPQQTETVRQGGIVTQVSRRNNLFRAVVRIDDRYCVLTLTKVLGLMDSLQYFQRMISLVPMMMGAIMMVMLVLTVVRPVKRLSNAAKQVARGDLTVQVTPQGQDEIAELTDNFNMMVRELSKNEYLHKDFVTSVSHEFKTPITSLTGYAKLLRDENLDEATRHEYADIIIEQSNRLSRLSTDLLRLAELDNENMPRKLTTFSLSEQIRSIVILLQNEWEQKDIAMNVELAEVTVTGERELLYIVWTNLISNAIRYAPAGSGIDIDLAAGPPVRVAVRNAGALSDSDRENIWNRFYKSDKSRSGVGTGLGLPIAQRIIEIHKGSIAVDSADGFVTFTVTL